MSSSDHASGNSSGGNGHTSLLVRNGRLDLAVLASGSETPAPHGRITIVLTSGIRTTRTVSGLGSSDIVAALRRPHVAAVVVENAHLAGFSTRYRGVEVPAGCWVFVRGDRILNSTYQVTSDPRYHSIAIRNRGELTQAELDAVGRWARSLKAAPASRTGSKLDDPIQ